MGKWEMTKTGLWDYENIDKNLAEGWEPFAATPETTESDGSVYFKRRLAAPSDDSNYKPATKNEGSTKSGLVPTHGGPPWTPEELCRAQSQDAALHLGCNYMSPIGHVCMKCGQLVQDTIAIKRVPAQDECAEYFPRRGATMTKYRGSAIWWTSRAALVVFALLLLAKGCKT